MKLRYLIVLSFLVSSYSFSQTVGIGIYSKSNVYHSKNNQINFTPLINLESKKFYLKGYKIGLYFYKEPNFNVSVFFDPLVGYSDLYIKNSDLKEGYKNIKSRNTFIGGGIAADFILDKKTFGRVEISGGDKGIKGEMRFNQSFILTDRITFTPGVYFKFFNKKYVNHFLGTDINDTKKNEKINKVYKGKDTIVGGLNANLDFSITEQMTATIFTGVELYDNIKDSPLVKKEYSYYAGIGLRYSF
ncbi:MAG: MipA/OmpV family protein [Fusobacterium sp.]|uniref:MipA/OmpV family protein n=1 Tax=Fusobacterium sp. TaxID=68766 RepID=UPI0026DC21E8|nr:MipA/OmpV family protein [Fusobacterium sp.]MDO4689835.1 MipA/OmpV family protein [Fusobacterium sp.]